MNCLWLILLLCCCGNNGCGSQQCRGGKCQDMCRDAAGSVCRDVPGNMCRDRQSDICRDGRSDMRPDNDGYCDKKRDDCGCREESSNCRPRQCCDGPAMPPPPPMPRGDARSYPPFAGTVGCECDK